MYVLSVKNGYLVVDGNPADGYSVEELGNSFVSKSEKEKAGYRLAINGSERWSKLIKTGDIALQRYNDCISQYIDQGGSLEDAERILQSKKIKSSAPFPPVWLYPDKQECRTLSDIDFQEDITYLQTGFVPFDGEIVPIFIVSSIDELYWYDLFRLREAHLRIKRCEDCGCAFVAKTTAIRCDGCRKAGKGEEKKQANIKNDPARKLIKGILNRSASKKRPSVPKTYLNDLASVISELRSKKVSNDELISSLKKWDMWDKTYYKLCRFFREDNDTIIEYELQTKWNNECTQFPKTDHPEQWLTEWCRKANIRMK